MRMTAKEAAKEGLRNAYRIGLWSILGPAIMIGVLFLFSGVYHLIQWVTS